MLEWNAEQEETGDGMVIFTFVIGRKADYPSARQRERLLAGCGSKLLTLEVGVRDTENAEKEALTYGLFNAALLGWRPDECHYTVYRV